EGQLRVAREVHDVVAHTLGTIGVEAGVARHVASLPVEDLRRVLGEIEDSARSALEQVQGLVRTLRTDGKTLREPAPGLAQLPALIDRAERAGVETSLHLSGLEDWSESEQFTVFRIVQEAITNVIRHAPGASCQVAVTSDPSMIRVEVRDDGPGRPPTVLDGHGLTGMRERVHLAGGDVLIGNHADGGFQVRVELPRSAGEDESA
ncbi:MAG TPA: sensor histidine kinase, partial [Nonomuraea sp.]|nr:sensor histidine kinase [Nonomuraea sp.]